MKKFLAILLAVIMVMSMAACGAKAPAETTKAPETTAAPEETTVPEETEPLVVEEYPAMVGPIAVTTTQKSAGSVDIDHSVFAGVAGKDYTDEKVYTYNDFLTATSDMKWAPHTWETNDDSVILDMISTGFYTFVVNADASNWAVTTEMAAEYPVDVTAEYVGQFGIEEGETGKAWKITLNPAACWEDGTPINADTYIYSYKELLDPINKCRRADSLYAGDFVIAGSKEYFKQGSVAHADLLIPTAAAEEYIAMDAFEKDEEGFYLVNGNRIAFNLTDGGSWSSNSLTEYYEAGYFENECWDTVLNANADASGDVFVNDDVAAALTEIIAVLHDYATPEDYAADAGDYAYQEWEEFCYTTQSYGEYSWDNVGIVKTGDYEIVMVAVAPVNTPEFYLPYNLSSTYLVYEPMWEACKTYYDADGNKVDRENAVSMSTNYCTSAETTISYGPYKLTYFELDKQFTLERNENWYGYSDGKHLGQYQMDVYSVSVIPTQATQLLSFLNGEIDNVSLTAGDMETYGSSQYISYTPQSYTTKLTFNTDEASLTSHGTGSQIQGNLNFRKAFSLAIDSATFASSYTAAGTAGYGMLNRMYVADATTGDIYRDSEGGKLALINLFEMDLDDYDDVDEAYDAITGYDLDLARATMAKAYDECVATGLYDGSSNVTLDMRVYTNDDIYVQMFNFLNDALKAACVGTGFEGKVEMTMTADSDYYNSMYSGSCDIIFTTWGGATYGGFGMLDRCYLDAPDGSGNQMEYGFDGTKSILTINIDGEDFTENLVTWGKWMDDDVDTVISNGTTTLAPFAAYDAETKCNLFGNLEYALMSNFCTTSLYYRNAASLNSQKGQYAVSSYLDLIAFGGLQFYTFNYDDAEWAAVASTLTY